MSLLASPAQPAVSAVPLLSPTGSPLFTRARIGVLAVIFLIALAFRLDGLSARGLSEDEASKLRAIDSFRRGDFSANAEHPMLMKLAIWGSVSASDAWNARVPPALGVTPEAAVRLPNAVAGAATTLAVYGAAALLLEPAVALIAAFLIASDPTIISVNRLGKEDTFLVFFFALAVFLYERAKRIWQDDADAANRSYNVAGACFGLMLASKYFPHLLGLHCLFNMAAVRNAGRNAPRLTQYLPAMAVAFLVANFAILRPETWTYIAQYLNGHHQPHHGHLYDGQLYVNSATILLWGVPWTYYLRMIATKMPLMVIAAALASLPLLVTRRRERGFVWLRVFLVIQLVGYAVVASKFQRYALWLFVVIDMLAAVVLAAAFRWFRQQATSAPASRLALSGLAAGVFVLVTLWPPLVAAPHFSMYQNAVGALSAPVARVYPEESYDYGVREAVTAICDAAGDGAVIVSDAEQAVDYYLRHSKCRTIESRSLSGNGLGRRGEQWVLAQDNHLSFENASLVAQLRAQQRPWREYRLYGQRVLEVYRVVR